jgi:osmoprotectant transport system permease protein
MSDVAAQRGGVPLLRIHNRVAFSLATLSLVAVLRLGFLGVAANRLADGQSVPFWAHSPIDAAAIFVPLVALMLASLLGEKRPVLIGTFIAATLVLFATLFVAGDISTWLAQNAPPAQRRSLGSAFWVLIVASPLAMIDTLQKLRAGIVWGAAIAFAAALGIAAMAVLGAFDNLSLAREFVGHREAFFGALLRHVELISVALFLAILLATPLTLLLLYRVRWRASVFGALNLLQTIPSIALFGLLIAPLSFAATNIPLLARLGIGGIGAAPAVIALVLYSLLPLVRNATAGLASVDPAVIDSARGIGMTEGEIFRQVRLPLALPALASALRIVTIQAIGLATIAALIGAGGLGDFIFQGIGQYALDLVLVGALPIVLLAAATDLAFQIWLAALRGVL